MTAKFKSKFPQGAGGSAGKSVSNSKGAKDHDYPNIIEEPIRIVGDKTQGESKAGKSRKQSAKRSAKTPTKKSRKKKRS
jgi:hypothetical protein